MEKRNLKFTVLSAIAMLLVILGHLDCNYLTFGGLFPYYSYHVMIFVFISGYFYKTEDEKKPLAYIYRKFLRLMIPYFAWNIVYGIITVILHGKGFLIGGDFNCYNLFLSPFVGGHQFMYNATAWFVPALFALEICNIAGRKLLSVIHIKNEWVIMALYLAMGVFTVYMARRGSVYDYYKIPGRLMLMAPVFQMGRIYREKLERLDIVPTIIYIPLVIVMNLVLVKTHGGLAYSTVWVTGFANTVFTPFITAITGIAFWLRVSRIIADRLTSLSDENIFKRFTEYFGSHTLDVCMHQLIVFMGIKQICLMLGMQGFDTEKYISDVYYTYAPEGMEAFKLIYVIAGVLVSLLIGYIVRNCIQYLTDRITANQKGKMI